MGHLYNGGLTEVAVLYCKPKRHTLNLVFNLSQNSPCALIYPMLRAECGPAPALRSSLTSTSRRCQPEGPYSNGDYYSCDLYCRLMKPCFFAKVELKRKRNMKLGVFCYALRGVKIACTCQIPFKRGHDKNCTFLENVDFSRGCTDINCVLVAVVV